MYFLVFKRISKVYLTYFGQFLIFAISKFQNSSKIHYNDPEMTTGHSPDHPGSTPKKSVLSLFLIFGALNREPNIKNAYKSISNGGSSTNHHLHWICLVFLCRFMSSITSEFWNGFSAHENILYAAFRPSIKIRPRIRPLFRPEIRLLKMCFRPGLVLEAFWN